MSVRMSSVATAREGERGLQSDLPERELTRGWLKASHRAIDPKRSKPGRPWHPLTREAQKPVVPGEVTEYAIEILATANQFKTGHRICLDITSLDLPTGVGGATNVEYIPYHICSSRRCCTRSTTTRSTRRICCCRSSRTSERAA